MKDKKTYSLKYPRLVLLRRSMTALGRLLLVALANAEIHGKERLPKKGAMILAGNHVAVLEAVMMAVYTPGIVEFIGAGDIPFDPNYAWIANTYNLIYVNRGNLDREALKKGVDILKQDGLLGIFPEGGIWNPANMDAQIGVALLSYQAQAPILPIGFGGIKGALADAFRFKRPHVVMNVGQVIPPVRLEGGKTAKKVLLQQAANHIMMKINALIPPEEVQRYRRRVDEKYKLEIRVMAEGESVNIPKKYQVTHGSAYARFLYNPVMMDVLYRNLKLPIKSIRRVRRQKNLTSILTAWESILAYLDSNPGYFTYRFGIDEGVAAKKSLEELSRLAEWVQESGYNLSLLPVRCYRNANTNAKIVERGGCFPKSMHP